jgi:GntR family transcriptional regulator
MEQVTFDNTQVPLHYQIADYLLIMLQKGSLPIDERVPPEEELCKVFSVSRTTVRRAVDHLLQKGLIMKKQGKGTFWTKKAGTLEGNKPSGINRQIFNITEETTVKVLAKYTEKAPPHVADFLKLPHDSDVIIFKRLRFINREPMSITINYMPVAVGTNIEKKHLEEMTMLETLETVIKIDLGIVEHEVEITRANSEVARHLKVPVLDPVLTVNTSVFDSEGEPVEIVWTHFVEDKYKFRVVLDK